MVSEQVRSDGGDVSTAEKLFQGPMLTHVGQIAILRRRMAEVPVRGDNYFVADIAVGQTGPAQPTPRREFD